MKSVAHTIFICIVTLLFSCCDDSSNYVNSDWSLSANPQYFDAETPSGIVIPSRGGSHSVSFETSDNWSVVSNSSWIHVNSTSGTAGQHVLTIQAEDNPSVDARFDTTYIQSTNPEMHPFRIITKQAGRFFTASADILTFESKGGTATIEIDTDDDWKVSSCPEWITMSQTQGNEKVSVSATISEFPTETHREGTIVIESSVCGNQSFDVAQTCDNYQPWLSFTSDGAQTLRFTYEVPTLEYSVNGGEWQELGTKEVAFGGDKGELRLRGKSSYGTIRMNYDDEYMDGTILFGTESKVACDGDIRTLVDFEHYYNVVCRYARFSRLFKGCHQLVSVPQLPTMNLASYCYFHMFDDCTSLTIAPQLPATALAASCYEGMFSGCSSLEAAPQLPATNLKVKCYLEMFAKCSSLTTAPQLPATILAPNCYERMFYICSSLTTAPQLPATILAHDCYYAMFAKCSSLTVAPQLPATNLASYCYGAMFSGCSSLVVAPQLPATTLASNCYYYMFHNCSSLISAPQLPAEDLAFQCYSEMFLDCSSLTSAPQLPATTLATNCYWSMFEGCSSLATAPQLPATTLTNGCYAKMFCECRSLTTAPQLPATVLAEECYYRMFGLCENLSYIEMMSTDISAKECLYSWVYMVSSQGTFVKNSNATWDENGVIPNGWTVITK